MKLIAIFKGNKLLEYRTELDAIRSYEYKENVSTITHIPVSEMEAVMFEDEALDEYVNTQAFMPKKSWEINKTKISLFDLVPAPSTRIRKVKWMDCGEDELAQFFSPEEIALIEVNKAYYATLGPEKFHPNYVIQWPHIIEPKTVEVESNSLVRTLVKEIHGEILPDIIPESEEPTPTVE